MKCEECAKSESLAKYSTKNIYKNKFLSKGAN